MPRRNEIQNVANSLLFSVEVYDSLDYFKEFNPSKEFEKWAAVEVKSFENNPLEMKQITIPAGLYAVFHYKGKPSEVGKIFNYIFWNLDFKIKLRD